MKLVVDRQAALEALAGVSKITPTNVANPVLTYAKLEIVDGELFISATDLSTRIVALVCGPMRAEGDGKCLLPAAGLTQALRASSSPYLGLSTGDTESDVQVVLGNTTYRWKTVPVDHFPDILTLNTEAESHVVDRRSFHQALKEVRPAIPKDVSDPRFNQIGVRNGLLQAADGVRYHQSFVADAALIDAALPAPFVSDMMSLISDSADSKITFGISEDKKALSVRVGGTTLMTRAQAETFPDISQVFTNARMSNQESVQVERDDLLNAVRRVRMLADAESGAVTLQLEGDRIKVSARQQSGSWASEPVSMVYAGPDRTLVVHHQHLMGLLGMFDTGATVQLMVGPDSRSRPSSVHITDDQRIGVITQLRLGWRHGAS